MNKKMDKRQRDIKSKLMAAICMLLVSSLLMVSTTYAWFTLSTAPEVTGIQTAVGANGNLEMALLPTDGITQGVEKDYGITSNVGDSNATRPENESNTTWGNLVDLSDNTFYGLDKLTLYPSALNATVDNDTTKNPTQIGELMLQTPEYGADGRVSKLEANTVTSLYENGSFPQKEGYGVRAVGTASGMTDRQLAYRNSRSTASTAMAQAKTFASQSLNTNGAALANIAMAHGVNAGATHTQEDIAALLAIVNDLLGDGDTTGVLQYVEKAYKNYIIAYAASAANAPTEDDPEAGMSDEAFKTFRSEMEACADAEAIKNLLTTADPRPSYPDDVDTRLNALVATKNTVKEAKTMLQSMTDPDNDGYTWNEISTPLYKLANTDSMEINGFAASTVKDNLNAIINKVTAGDGLTVTIATGGGVYADIADHCGDYNAQITIQNVSYGGLTLESMPARMETKTTVTPVHLVNLGDRVLNAGEPAGTGQVMPITDFFGYVIDLAFKTNAAESNLLLQTEAVDRIYEDGGAEDTMGHGATMTFTSTTTDFTTEQLVELMDAIRIVFFDPSTSNTVYATAKLDMAEGQYQTVGGNTVTANIYLYENVASSTTYEPVGDGGGGTHVVDEAATTYQEVTSGTGTHVVDDENGGYREATEEEEGTHIPVYSYKVAGEGEAATHVEVKTAGGTVLEKTQTNAVITPLQQNTAKAVSVLVYLDGNYVTNADVASVASTSMTGSMNLQFASSANLVPMNYTPLMEQGSSSETTEATTVPTTSEG